MSYSKLPPLGSNQLDASLLDSALHNLLLESLSSAFLLPSASPSHPSPLSAWYAGRQSEVHLALRAAAFAATTMRCEATPGMKLQGLAHDGRTRKLSVRFLLVVATVLLPYAAEKARKAKDELEAEARRSLENGNGPSVSTSRSRKLRFLSLVSAVNSLVAILSSLNFLAFLATKSHPTLSSRLLSLPYARDASSISTSPPSSRPVNYSLLSRRLLWDGTLRLAAAVSPLTAQSLSYTLASVRDSVTSLFRWRAPHNRPGVVGGPSSSSSPPSPEEERGRSRRQSCALCGASPARIPHGTSCGCTCCYLCLHTRGLAAAGEPWRCAGCGGRVEGSGRRGEGGEEGRAGWGGRNVDGSEQR